MLSRKKIFYVYLLLDPRKLGNYDYGKGRILHYEPFYVGKGKRNRLHSHVQGFLRGRGLKSNTHKTNKIRNILKEGLEVITKKIKCKLTERQAFQIERKAIALIGRSDIGNGPLTNHSDGGEGPSNPSERTRKRLRFKARRQAKRRTPKEWSKINLAIKRARLNRTSKENAEIEKRKSKALVKNWSTRTEKEIKKRTRKIQRAWSNKSKEELAKFSRLMSNRQKRNWKNYSKEKKIKISQNMSKGALGKVMTKATRRKMTEVQKARHAKLTKKQKIELGNRISKGRAKASPEKREASRERYSQASLLREANYTKAQRKQRSKRMSISASNRGR